MDSRPGGEGDGAAITPMLAEQLLDAVGQAVVASNLDHAIVYWNRAAERLFGWKADEVIGRNVIDVLTPLKTNVPVGSADEYFASVLAGRRRSFEALLATKHRQDIWVRASHTVITDPSGRAMGMVGISYDVTGRRRSEEAMHIGYKRYRALVQRSTDVAVIVALDGTLTYVSPGVHQLLGFTPEDLVGSNGWDLVFPDDLPDLRVELRAIAQTPGAHTTCEYRIRTVDDDYIWVEETVTNMLDEPAVNGLVANLRDITDRKRIEADLNHRVLHDELTGLPNRTHLDLALNAALQQTAGAAVLVLDIDQFKLINDSHGHGAGDELLTQVSARLQDSLRPGDLAGRFGGDEFVVVCRDVADTSQAEVIAERLQAMLREPFVLSGVGTIFVTASVGIAAAEVGTSAAELFHDADAAMYEAKRTGRARLAIYDDAMRERATLRLRIESELRLAIDSGEIVAHFQPIVDLHDGTIVGAEALARWDHPTRGVLFPAEFIAVAEDAGLIIELDRHIMSQALAAARRWSDLGHELRVAVNVSSLHLVDPGLVPLVAAKVAEAGTRPSQLSLEVTETAVMSDPRRSIEVVNDLTELGVHLALDDFGTGYSSLVYLKQLPVTTVKVDRGFVAGVHCRPDDRDIVSAIVGLARAFGRHLVAEGVESEEQLVALRELGCTMAQGFYWSPAVPEDRFTAMLVEGLVSDRDRPVA